jgi:MOSC domain-containing protein YiiM
MYMWDGELEAIFTTPTARGRMQSRNEVTVLDGKGLEGDRYAAQAGSFSKKVAPGRHVTLIEAEAIEAVRAETGIPLTAEQTRRNLVTRGVPLNHLVGREFNVGGVVLVGIRLCEPCEVVEAEGGPGSRQALLHRAGLRAEVVRAGVIRVGDHVQPTSVVAQTAP